MSRLKTEQCLWCGVSEARGAVLRLYRIAISGVEKWVCTDEVVCARNIQTLVRLGFGR